MVVLSHRPGAWLADCLESVAGQADQVVVVDNASPGGAAAATGRRVGATVVASPLNLGFAGGVNLGLRHATGDVVALLNDDAVAGDGWLASATRVLEDPGVAAVTPKVLLAGWWREVVFDDQAWFAPGDPRPLGRRIGAVTVDGAEQIEAVAGVGVHQLERAADGAGGVTRWRWTAGPRPWYVPLPDPSYAAAVAVDGRPAPPGPAVRLVNNAGAYMGGDVYFGDVGYQAPDDGRFDAPAEPFAASGAALVTTAATLARLGGLAEPYFAYYEDSDWCWRARLAGLRIVYDPAVVVEHRRSATSASLGPARVRWLAERNRTLTAVRNAPLPVARRLVVDKLRAGPDTGIRRAVLRRLPWAAATRVELARAWRCRPEEVWERWAGAGTAWDTGPARVEGFEDPATVAR